MGKANEAGRQILNSSGFPFQLRVAEEIKRTPARHGWRLVAEEHYWWDEETRESGFIDVIAGYGIVRLVIECKRGADVRWLFLARSTDPEKVTRSRVLCTDKVEGEPDVRVWADMHVTPDSPEAAFCIVKGQGDKEPMLERIGATLLQSVEALADEELRLPKPQRISERRIYQPVIVTSATLQFCQLDPLEIGLEDGRLPNTSEVEFADVPFVKFRKALSGVRRSEAKDFEAAQSENQRTILLVQAKALKHLLEGWEISPALGGQWPQIAERERMRWAQRTGP